jgi:hypothetical protein
MIIKKTILAALAAAVMSTAVVPLVATQSQAGHYYGHRGYVAPRHYVQPQRHCRWEQYGRWYDGYQWHWKRRWVCG